MFSKKIKILTINLNGVISYEDGSLLSKKKNILDIIDKLHSIVVHDSKYRAVILRINSPGGTATASEELTIAIKNVRKNGIPIVASIGDIAASGAYMAASACTRIFANRMSLVGSIGTIMQIPDLSEISKKIGARYNIIKSGEFKDIGNPTREMTQEEREYLELLTQKSHEEFIRIIEKNRDIINNENLYDGKLFNAHIARKFNLIDEFGTYYDAVRYVCKKLEVEEKDIKIEDKKKNAGLFSTLLTKLSIQFLKNSVPELRV